MVGNVEPVIALKKKRGDSALRCKKCHNYFRHCKAESRRLGMCGACRTGLVRNSGGNSRLTSAVSQLSLIGN